MSELKCEIHGHVRETSCSWCGNHICKKCIESSELRKYCSKCYIKLSRDSFANDLDRQWRTKTVDFKSNIDPTLSDDFVKETRAMLEEKEKIRLQRKEVMEKY